MRGTSGREENAQKWRRRDRLLFPSGDDDGDEYGDDGGDRRGGGRMVGCIRQMLMMVIKMKWCVYRKKEATITK